MAGALLRLNTLGPLGLTRAVLPYMLRRSRGRHVVVASMAAVVPSPGQSAYAAAKAGLRAYFLSMAAELADRWGRQEAGCVAAAATALRAAAVNFSLEGAIAGQTAG